MTTGIILGSIAFVIGLCIYVDRLLDNALLRRIKDFETTLKLEGSSESVEQRRAMDIGDHT